MSAGTHRCTAERRPLDGTVMSLFQSNNQFMCGVECQKRGNINFFAPGNLNISRKDINTITTQTHTHPHAGPINLLCNRTLSSGSNITVNGDAYLQAVLPLK